MKKIMAGNWKMHLTIQESRLLASDVVKETATFASDAEIVICPGFVSLSAVNSCLTGSTVRLGAQNMHHRENGAFTGECSGIMLRDSGCDYVILGHSERRHIFGEDDSLIHLKVSAALHSGLKPILCVGETDSERDQGLTNNVVERQMRAGLYGMVPDNTESVVLAYEPVWAIGTGRSATPEQAQDVHAFIRGLLQELFPGKSAVIPILYGGSVKPENASALLSQPDIDGALVGGAALKKESFAELVRLAALART